MERWIDIDGFDGFYQISSTGKVRSRGGADGRERGGWRLRKISLTKDGYQKVRLVRAGRDITMRVHRLVAEAFIPNPDALATVNHKDGNKKNNNVENLEWADRHYQMIHAYKHGLKKAMAGSDNCWAKLSADDVKYIRTHYKRRSREYGTVALGEKFGVSNRVIGLITRGLSYKNVGSD